MNIFMILITIIGGAAGIFSTLYIIVSMFAVIAFKLYRKTVHHISLYE